MSARERKVLIPVADLYEDLELHYPRLRLMEEGAHVLVCGSGQKTYAGKRGYPATVDFDLRELKLDYFDAVIVPGGFAPDKLRVRPNRKRRTATTPAIPMTMTLELPIR